MAEKTVTGKGPQVTGGPGEVQVSMTNEQAFAAVQKCGELATELEQMRLERDAARKVNEQLAERAQSDSRRIIALEQAVAERESEIAKAEETEETLRQELARWISPSAYPGEGPAFEPGFIESLDLTRISDDLERSIHDDPFMFVETINFRHDSGYSSELRKRAVASVERALTAERTGHEFQNLPPFAPGNRLFVAVGVLSVPEEL